MDRDSAKPDVSTVPGPEATEWINYHQKHAAKSTYVYGFVWDITKEADGPFCQDPDDNVLLDFTSHVGANPLGYNNSHLIEEFSKFDLVDPTKIAGQDFYVSTGGLPESAPHGGPSHLMDRLTDISDHYGFDTVFLSNSGAEAVENAIKICYDNTSGQYGITFDGAFHGRTLGTLSLNRSRGHYRKKFPEVPTESVPYCRNSSCSAATCSCGFFADDPGSQLRALLEGKYASLGAEKTAYIIIEPIQGEGGYYVPSDAFMDEVQELSAEHDIPVVCDEVQAGLGRTGEWFGSDHYNLEPDVISLAKPARVGATIASEEMFPDHTGRLSSTWGAGDMIASMQGAATIDVIEEQSLLKNATERGEQMLDLLEDSTLPNVTEIRGEGLMIGVEFSSTSCRDATVDEAFSEGLLLLGCGEKTVRLLPPLNVTEREVRLGCQLFAEAVQSADGDSDSDYMDTT